ncbi:hypothetical protein EV421DRAFT_1867433, partial [Armillaria borealis]
AVCGRQLIMVPPPVSLRLCWWPPVCLILDLIVFGAQGRSDFMRLGIAGCLAHTCHECVFKNRYRLAYYADHSHSVTMRHRWLASVFGLCW